MKVSFVCRVVWRYHTGYLFSEDVRVVSCFMAWNDGNFLFPYGAKVPVSCPRKVLRSIFLQFSVGVGVFCSCSPYWSKVPVGLFVVRCAMNIDKDILRYTSTVPREQDLFDLFLSVRTVRAV